MKYCNNCKAEKASGADYPWYNSQETFAREERCGACKRGTLSREILTDSNSENIIFGFFVTAAQAINNGMRGKDLEDYVQSRTNISTPIWDVTEFEANGNKNLLTIINSTNSNYSVFLLVYDSKIYTFPTHHSETKGGIGNARVRHSSLSNAQSELGKR